MAKENSSFGESFKEIESALGHPLPSHIAGTSDIKRDEKINTLLLCEILKQLKEINVRKAL